MVRPRLTLPDGPMDRRFDDVLADESSDGLRATSNDHRSAGGDIEIAVGFASATAMLGPLLSRQNFHQCAQGGIMNVVEWR